MKRGQRQVEFTHYPDVFILNICLKKNPVRKWTCNVPIGMMKNEMEFILINIISKIKDFSTLNTFRRGSSNMRIRS